MSIPSLNFMITLPEQLVRGDRLHNRFVKETMREVIEDHWRKQIPRHFQGPARARYGYRPRPEAYVRYKLRRFKRGTDLVKTGRTMREMTSRSRIMVGGQASAGTVTATLRLRFAFDQQIAKAVKARISRHGRAAAPSQYLGGGFRTSSVAQMRDEIQRTTKDERYGMALTLKYRYLERVKTETKARQRIKI